MTQCERLKIRTAFLTVKTNVNNSSTKGDVRFRKVQMFRLVYNKKEGINSCVKEGRQEKTTFPKLPDCRSVFLINFILVCSILIIHMNINQTKYDRYNRYAHAQKMHMETTTTVQKYCNKSDVKLDQSVASGDV